MAAYTNAPGGVETEPEERTKGLKEKSCKGWMWKAFGALLFVVLCIGGIRVFAWYWMGRPELATYSNQTEPIIKKTTSEKTDPNFRLISTETKAAIHLVGSVEYDKNVGEKLMWSDDIDQAMAQGGFRLVNNQIVIPQTGVYFVYSQTVFRVFCSDNYTMALGKHLSSRVWRYSAVWGERVPLVMSMATLVCQNIGEEGDSRYKTIYLGAVFHLRTEDRLLVESHPVSDVESDSGKTFFGAFAL